MAIHYRTQGLIIKKEDRGEADQFFTIFTKNFGKLEILGKAIRKIKSKLRGGAELFYLSEIEFIQGKVYKTLTDTFLIDSFSSLRKKIKRLKTAYKIAEISDNLIRCEEKDEKIWRLFIETFEELNVENQKPQIHNLVYYYFLWNLLSFSGYQPQLYNCVACQKKLIAGNLYFAAGEGGIICPACFKKSELPRPSGDEGYPSASASWRMAGRASSFAASSPTTERRGIAPQNQKEKDQTRIRLVDSDIVKILRVITQENFKFFSKLKIEISNQRILKEISEDFLFIVSPLKENC